jgi:hypothetical protein
MNVKTISAVCTLGFSLNSMFDNFSQFNEEVGREADVTEQRLYPFKYNAVATNDFVRDIRPDGGDTFLRELERIRLNTAQKSNVQKERASAIKDVREKVQDARDLYSSEREDYRVRLSEREQAREDARIFMEQQQSIRADRELALREANQKLQNDRMALEQERFDLEKVVAERNRIEQEEKRAAAVGNSAFKNAQIQLARNAVEQTAQIAEAASRADAERLRIQGEQLRAQEEALREQIAGNQSSVSSGVSQATALQASIGQLTEVISNAVAAYSAQQNRLSSLQDGEGRAIHNRGRALDEMENSVDRIAAITPSQRLDIRNSLILSGIQSVSNEMIDLIINAGSGDLRGLEERIRAIESLSVAQEEPLLAFVNAPSNRPRIQSQPNQGRRLVEPIGAAPSRPNQRELEAARRRAEEAAARSARAAVATGDPQLNALRAQMQSLQAPTNILSAADAFASPVVPPPVVPPAYNFNSLSERLQRLKNSGATPREKMAFLSAPGVISGLMNQSQPANALNFRAFQGPAQANRRVPVINSARRERMRLAGLTKKNENSPTTSKRLRNGASPKDKRVRLRNRASPRADPRAAAEPNSKSPKSPKPKSPKSPKP